MDQFQGRVAILTGAGSGVGRATALALARQGTAILAVGTTAARLEAVAAEIESSGGKAASLMCDVTDPGAFVRMRDLAIRRFGRVDILVNNAGAIGVGYPEDIPIEEWQRTFDVNVMAVARSLQVFVPLFLAQGSGHFVNVASVDALFGFGFDRLPYASSKAALAQMSEGLALYLRPRGIGVTCFCPGPVATNIGQGMRMFGRSIDVRGAGAMFEMMPVDGVGDMIVNAIRDNVFLLTTHPVTHEIVRQRAASLDDFIDHQIAHPHILFTTPGATEPE